MRRMRFRLRTLIIVLAVLPPLLARGWSAYCGYIERQRIVNSLKPPLGFIPGVIVEVHTEGPFPLPVDE